MLPLCRIETWCDYLNWIIDDTFAEVLRVLTLDSQRLIIKIFNVFRICGRVEE